MNEWINKLWYTHAHTHTHTYIHIIDYYSAIQKNEILKHAAAWINLRSITLSERKQYYV